MSTYAILRGGPADGAEVTLSGSSVIVQGEEFDRPGEVARYRRTRQGEGDRTVYTFRGWDRVMVRVTP